MKLTKDIIVELGGEEVWKKYNQHITWFSEDSYYNMLTELDDYTFNFIEQLKEQQDIKNE